MIQKLTIKENLLYFQFVALGEMFESCHLQWKATTNIDFQRARVIFKSGP